MTYLGDEDPVLKTLIPLRNQFIDLKVTISYAMSSSHYFNDHQIEHSPSTKTIENYVVCIL